MRVDVKKISIIGKFSAIRVYDSVHLIVFNTREASEIDFAVYDIAWSHVFLKEQFIMNLAKWNKFVGPSLIPKILDQIQR